MRTNHSSDCAALVIFSWGAPARLDVQIARLNAVPDSVIWTDPLSRTDVPDGLGGVTSLERIQAVLGGSEPDVDMIRYSLPDLYSLSPATANLMALWPGLKRRPGMTVPVISTDNLAARLQAVEGGIHVVIDMPGAEYRVLALLDMDGLAGKVQAISLRCGVESFFEGASDSNALLEALALKGFSVTHESHDDPDWPEYSLKADARAHLILKLEAQVEEKQAALASAQNDAAARAEEIMDLSARVTERDTELAQLRIDLDTRATERNAVQKKLEAEQADREKEIAAHAEEIRDLSARVVERDTELAQLRIDLDTRATERNAVQKKLEAEQADREEEIAAHAESRTRLMLVREEIRRAEGQIELIKDLLLREPEL